jgi:hypothetical protein
LEAAIGDDIAGLEAGRYDRVALIGDSRFHGCHDSLAGRLIAPAAAAASATSVVSAALAAR